MDTHTTGSDIQFVSKCYRSLTASQAMQPPGNQVAGRFASTRLIPSAIALLRFFIGVPEVVITNTPLMC